MTIMTTKTATMTMGVIIEDAIAVQNAKRFGGNERGINFLYDCQLSFAKIIATQFRDELQTTPQPNLLDVRQTMLPLAATRSN